MTSRKRFSLNVVGADLLEVPPNTIEWTLVPNGKGGRKKSKTWNPIRGCTHAGSPGCDNCYAEAMAGRFDKPGLWAEGLTLVKPSGRKRWSGLVYPHVPTLLDPLGWRDPCGVFVNSTSDVFHEELTKNDAGLEYIAAMFWVMAMSQRHTFMLLTKRPERALWFFTWLEAAARAHWAMAGDNKDAALSTMIMRFLWACASEVLGREEFARICKLKGLGDWYGHVLESRWPLANLWLGATIEDQPRFDLRWPVLEQLPAVVRFISYEPACGPLVLSQSALEPGRLGWLIAGGESGHFARPAHPQWFRDVIAQCEAASIASFFKQHGEWIEVAGHDPSWERMVSFETGRAYARGEEMPIGAVPSMAFVKKIGKANAGRLLDGREYNSFPKAA